jgi:NAD(P)-dependent dehydrogenase (short-subunit alcohol dehydrogenase family)
MTASEATVRRVGLVTGASRGLGATIARLLTGERYDLVLVARTRAPLEAMANELDGQGARVEAVVGDVTDPGCRRDIVAAVERLGRIDLLVNNASELGPSPLPALSRAPLGELERVYRVNVIAPIALVQLLEPMLARCHGLVVNISSDAALGGYPGWGAYGASKAALDLASRTLAGELRDRHVSVVSVDPGDLRTTMHQSAYPGEDISDRPLPDVTVPFWVWLLGRPPDEISGHRYRAQAEHWGESG